MPAVAPPTRPAKGPEPEVLRDQREFRTNLTLITFVHLVIVLGCFVVGKLTPKKQIEQITWLDGGLAGGPSAAAAPAPEIIEEPEPEPEPEPMPEPDPVLPTPPPQPQPVAPSELPTVQATPVPATPVPATPVPQTPKPATPKPVTPKPATPKPATPKPKPATPKPKPATPKPTPKPAAGTPKPKGTPAPTKGTGTPAPEGNAEGNAAAPSNAKVGNAGKGNATGTGSGQGTAGTGPGAGKPSDFGWYFGLLRDRYYAVWTPPAVPDAATMVVTLKIRVKRDGTVLGHELTKSSGNSLMDGSVLEAARQITTIDPLPNGLGKDDIVEIPVNFEHE